MSLELRQLRYLVAVAEEGQITRAASKLHLAQPALSQAITQLESRLGVQLLIRHARGVTLTPEGEVLYERARTVLSAMHEADQAAAALSRSALGAVELGFLGAPPSVHIPELFEAFAEAHPECEIHFRELPFPSGTTASWIKDVDLAMCHPPAVQADVNVQILRAESRTALVPKDHALAQQSSIDVADVLEDTFLGYHPEVDEAWTGFWSLDDHRGRPAASVTDHRVKTPIEMLAAVAAGKAITTVPSCHAASIVSVMTEVVALPLRDARPAALSLIWHKHSRNPSARAFLAVAQSFAEDGTVGILAEQD